MDRDVERRSERGGDRPRLFQRIRELPVVGRAADWGLGPAAVSKNTQSAGARIAGLEVTESVCPYCAVGCGQLVYTRDGELVDIEGNPRSTSSGRWT
jgi:formate dehydrogenase major subunit